MDLKQLVEVVKIMSADQGSSSPTNCPLTVGKCYLIRTVTMYTVGRVKAIHGRLVEMEQAAWVANTGRLYDALKDGEFSEVEPYPDGYALVNLDATVDVLNWNHSLPLEQK